MSMAPIMYTGEFHFKLKMKSQTIATGIVIERPTVTVRGDVKSIARAQRKSAKKEAIQLNIIMM